MTDNGVRAGLTVHEVTERTGLSRKALRPYEERGFVVPRRSQAGYRLYDAGALQRLELIRRARNLEVTSRELGEFLDIAEGCCDRDLDELVALIEDKVHETERRLGELHGLHDTLTATLSTLSTLRRDATTARHNPASQCPPGWWKQRASSCIGRAGPSPATARSTRRDR